MERYSMYIASGLLVVLNGDLYCVGSELRSMHARIEICKVSTDQKRKKKKNISV